MNSKFQGFSHGIMVGMTLIAVAGALRPVEKLIAIVRPVSSMKTAQAAALAGQGNFWAIAGGLRSAVAGGFWLRANLAWEHRELAATTKLIELTVAADERPLYFWLNGARILAYDLPEWRLEPAAPVARRRQVIHEQAQVALRLLERGLRWHGESADLYVEMANIHWRRLGDLEAAADYYRRAAEQLGAPYYAMRIYAELLVELGRRAEALAWLRAKVEELPAGDPAARRTVVESRIRQLEREVGGI